MCPRRLSRAGRAAPPLTLTVAEDGTFSIAREGAGLTDIIASVTVSGVERPLGAATASHAAGDDALPLGVTGVDSELFFFTVREALNPALAAWANAVARLAPPPEAPFVPVGWNSWNTLLEGVTRADVRKALFEWNRVLAMNGRLFVRTTDVGGLVRDVGFARVTEATEAEPWVRSVYAELVQRPPRADELAEGLTAPRHDVVQRLLLCDEHKAWMMARAPAFPRSLHRPSLMQRAERKLKRAVKSVLRR